MVWYYETQQILLLQVPIPLKQSFIFSRAYISSV